MADFLFHTVHESPEGAVNGYGGSVDLEISGVIVGVLEDFGELSEKIVKLWARGLSSAGLYRCVRV